MLSYPTLVDSGHNTTNTTNVKASCYNKSNMKVLSFSVFNSSTILLLFVLFTTKLHGTKAQLGGWHPVDNPTSSNVVKAATFAVESLDESTQSYSFVDTLSDDSSYTVSVGEASYQMVAGTKYRMKIIIMDSERNENAAEKVIGAFQVTVVVVPWADPKMSIVSWGAEIPKSVANQLYRDVNAQGGDGGETRRNLLRGGGGGAGQS